MDGSVKQKEKVHTHLHLGHRPLRWMYISRFAFSSPSLCIVQYLSCLIRSSHHHTYPIISLFYPVTSPLPPSNACQTHAQTTVHGTAERLVATIAQPLQPAACCPPLFSHTDALIGSRLNRSAAALTGQWSSFFFFFFSSTVVSDLKTRPRYALTKIAFLNAFRTSC